MFFELTQIGSFPFPMALGAGSSDGQTPDGGEPWQWWEFDVSDVQKFGSFVLHIGTLRFVDRFLSPYISPYLFFLPFHEFNSVYIYVF